MHHVYLNFALGFSSALTSPCQSGSECWQCLDDIQSCGIGDAAACAAEDGTYVSTGSTAELFDDTFKKGAHYVDVSGVPVWEVHDNSEVVQGSVKGRAVTKVARKRESWDGGFGSVDSVLYLAYEAKGAPCLTTLTCCHLCSFSHARTVIYLAPLVYASIMPVLIPSRGLA